MKTIVSQPFTELLRKKTAHQCTVKGISVNQTNLLAPALSPLVKKAGPNVIHTPVRSGTLESP